MKFRNSSKHATLGHFVGLFECIKTKTGDGGGKYAVTIDHSQFMLRFSEEGNLGSIQNHGEEPPQKTKISLLFLLYFIGSKYIDWPLMLLEHI